MPLLASTEGQAHSSWPRGGSELDDCSVLMSGCCLSDGPVADWAVQRCSFLSKSDL